MSPSQRPRGVLGFWSSLMTALGNTEHMPVGTSDYGSFFHYACHLISSWSTSKPFLRYLFIQLKV